eukprot:5437734-Prymnesium_polylepis.1
MTRARAGTSRRLVASVCRGGRRPRGAVARLTAPCHAAPCHAACGAAAAALLPRVLCAAAPPSRWNRYEAAAREPRPTSTAHTMGGGRVPRQRPFANAAPLVG